jgi:hypothetical protein
LGVKEGSDHCCDMTGMLGFLILFLQSKEIADEIAKRKGQKL